MSGPESPDAPAAPPAEAVEPGHRARALAASLLGELTGQRRSSLSFSPQEPSGLASVPRLEPPVPAQSPGDARAEQPQPAEAPRDVLPVTVVTTGPLPVADGLEAGAGPDEGSSTGRAAAPGTPSATPPSATPPSATPPSATPPSATPPSAGPSSASVPAEPVVRARHADAAPAERPAGAPAREHLGQDRSTSATPAERASAERAPVERAAAEPPVGHRAQDPTDRASAERAGERTAGERPAEPGQVGDGLAARPSGSPAPSGQDTTTAPTPARTGSGQGQGAQALRPAPFAYLAVAQHHTGPARATANGALDQAGQRISSRVERTMVRRAALVTTEAASLLDACDLLDDRARAVDATWTGERHSATEVREFEGAWGGFYDAQAALAQHVTG